MEINTDCIFSKLLLVLDIERLFYPLRKKSSFWSKLIYIGKNTRTSKRSISFENISCRVKQYYHRSDYPSRWNLDVRKRDEERELLLKRALPNAINPPAISSPLTRTVFEYLSAEAIKLFLSSALRGTTGLKIAVLRVSRVNRGTGRDIIFWDRTRGRGTRNSGIKLLEGRACPV